MAKKLIPGKDVGLKSKKNVYQTWNKILAANARASKARKKTDPELLKEFKKEFPKRKSYTPVLRIRSWFNSGCLNYGYGEYLPFDDARRSKQYDKEGNCISRQMTQGVKSTSGASRSPSKTTLKRKVKPAAKRKKPLKKVSGSLKRVKKPLKKKVVRKKSRK